MQNPSLGKPVYRKGRIVKMVRLDQYKQADRSEQNADLLGVERGEKIYEGFDATTGLPFNPVLDEKTGKPLLVSTTIDGFWCVFRSRETGDVSELHWTPDNDEGLNSLNLWITFGKDKLNMDVEVWYIGRDKGVGKKSD